MAAFFLTMYWSKIMLITYRKPALSFEKQIDQLISRGIQIIDKKAAVWQLSCINYYRLSAYWYPFRLRDKNGDVLDQVEVNTDFNKIITFYELDHQLRLLVLDAIERVEIAIRTQVTYHLAQAYGAFGHIDPANFHPQFDHATWLGNIEEETKRSNDEFIRHYRSKYEGFPVIPIWMLTEVMSLGSLSRLYTGLKNEDKKEVSKHFNVHHKRLMSWLHALTYIRNICAHHSRLWNRELAIRPDQAKEKVWSAPITPRNDRIFYILLILRHLLKATGNGSDWALEMNKLLEPFAKEARWRAAMGVPDRWKVHPIWS